jgi:hypothetical protein
LPYVFPRSTVFPSMSSCATREALAVGNPNLGANQTVKCCAEVLLPLVGITQERILVALWWVGVTNLTAVMSARTPVPAGAAEPDIASPVAPERRSEIARVGAADTARAVPADAASAGEAPAKAVAPGTAARHSAPTITRRSILLPGGLHGLHALISTFLEAYLGEI